MKIIGITGGVGSGKSRVLLFLEKKYKAAICQADQVAWELQKPGKLCYQKIVAHFGEEILNEDGTINRNILGQIVFQDETQLQVLNSIMHPTVKEEIQRCVQMERKKGTAIFVLEAALLVEEHYDEICDELWYIYTDEQNRRQRLKSSRQYSDEKIDRIMASQLPEAEFRKACQRVIDNNGTFEQTCIQLADALK